MTTLEQLIAEKARRLDENQQRKVLEFIELLQTENFDYPTWQNRVEAHLADLHENENVAAFFTAKRIFDELREKTSWINS